jgi:hypothetical protein
MGRKREGRDKDGVGSEGRDNAPYVVDTPVDAKVFYRVRLVPRLVVLREGLLGHVLQADDDGVLFPPRDERAVEQQTRAEPDPPLRVHIR